MDELRDVFLYFALFLLGLLITWVCVAALLGICWGMVRHASRTPGRLGVYLRDDQRQQIGAGILFIIIVLGGMMSLWMRVSEHPPSDMPPGVVPQ